MNRPPAVFSPKAIDSLPKARSGVPNPTEREMCTIKMRVPSDWPTIQAEIAVPTESRPTDTKVTFAVAVVTGPMIHATLVTVNL
jgi:hypothetical protein